MVARFRCCGGIFGADDWTMVLTMVYTTFPFARNRILFSLKLTGLSHTTFSTLGRLYGFLGS